MLERISDQEEEKVSYFGQATVKKCKRTVELAGVTSENSEGEYSAFNEIFWLLFHMSPSA